MLVCRSKDFPIQSSLLETYWDTKFLPWDISVADDIDFLTQFSEKMGGAFLIVDHYSADSEYQRRLLDNGLRWFQFDACRYDQVWADLVLNPSPAATICDYDTRKMRPETICLLGPSFIPIREEFSRWRVPKSTAGTARQILLTFGGGDDRGALLLSISAVQQLEMDTTVTILLTRGNPNKEKIQERVQESGQAEFHIIKDSKNIAETMSRMDVALIAGGTTSFEAAALGLPSMIISIAENQAPIARVWQDLEVAVGLGPIESIKAAALADSLARFMRNRSQREKMSEKGMRLVDGFGAKRTVEHILKFVSSQGTAR
jgi:UDP-2,4-diacetamido-2,4,6-trideoxy-beta-L-altropyranose hydrolase